MSKKKAPKRSQIEQMTYRIDLWPRPLRITLNTFISVVYTLILGYILSLILLSGDTIDQSRITPFIIGVTLLGFLIYGLGWWLLVGFDWDASRPWQARPLTTYFVLGGFAALGLVLLALLGALAFGFLL